MNTQFSRKVMRIQISLTKPHKPQIAWTISHVGGKLEEGRNLTSEAKEFGINKSVISRAWASLPNHSYSVRKIGGGRPRKTTAANDRHIVLQAKRTRCQSEKRNCSATVQQQENKARGLF
ncbi:transposable element Tcb2 transposase [Trichonephila clavipes]|nr:transposable element Tcb2 transposase [Trichonephila clavipes]